MALRSFLLGLPKQKEKNSLLVSCGLNLMNFYPRKVKEYFPKMSYIKISYHALILESRLYKGFVLIFSLLKIPHLLLSHKPNDQVLINKGSGGTGQRKMEIERVTAGSRQHSGFQLVCLPNSQAHPVSRKAHQDFPMERTVYF